MAITSMNHDRRDIDLRFYPRIDVVVAMTVTAGDTRREISSRNLSLRGIEADLEQADVDAIRRAASPGDLFTRVALCFDREPTGTPLDGLQLETDLFRLRRTSQTRYVGFFRFLDPDAALEALLHETLNALRR